MEFDDPEELDQFIINYQKVIECKECLDVTRLLAADLYSNPYLTVGMFLKNLSDANLEVLIDIVNDRDEVDSDEYAESMADFVLIAEMLSRAEGIVSDNDDEVSKKTNQLMVMVTLESLYRKGVIILHHQNLSFGDDAGKRVVAEKIPGMDYKGLGLDNED